MRMLAWGQDLLARTCQSRPLHRCSSRPSSAHAAPCLQRRVAARMSSSPKRHRGPLPGRPARRRAAGRGPGKPRGGGCPWLAAPLLLHELHAQHLGVEWLISLAFIPLLSTVCCTSTASLCMWRSRMQTARAAPSWWVHWSCSPTVLHALVGSTEEGRPSWQVL